MRFKMIFFLLMLVFAVYTGEKSYVIAKAGVQYGIPQLVGDGGGGLVFSLLCLITAFASLVYFRISMALLVLSSMLILLVGLTYQDNGTLYWSVIPVLLAVVNFIVHRRKVASVDTHGHTSHSL